jgi:large-conductance mechanosensitive channel
VLFFLVRAVQRFFRQAKKPTEVVLLTEIRDLLRSPQA